MTSDSYGLPFDYAETVAERIDAVTTDGVNNRARATLDPGSLTWVVVGDLAQIEEKVRSLGYGEVEVWDAFGKRVQ
jgi:predicted Zn-dependent peptidase